MMTSLQRSQELRGLNWRWKDERRMETVPVLWLNHDPVQQMHITGQVWQMFRYQRTNNTIQVRINHR